MLYKILLTSSRVMWVWVFERVWTLCPWNPSSIRPTKHQTQLKNIRFKISNLCQTRGEFRLLRFTTIWVTKQRVDFTQGSPTGGPSWAVNRRPAAQLESGLWARWLVNGSGHAKMLGPRASGLGGPSRGLFEISQNGFQKKEGRGGDSNPSPHA